MKNQELAFIFNRIADALEYKGELSFRIIAYRKAARALEELTEDIATIAAKGALREIPGIGEGIAKKIEEYLKTGKMKKYEEALAGIEPELLELLNIQNLGPKTLSLANKELGVKNLSDLKRVIEDGSLAKLFRMGEKKVENIKKGIEIYEETFARIPIDEALKIAEEVVAYLKKSKAVVSVEPSGSLRRMKETIGDIDLLVTGQDGAKIVNYFTKYPKVSRVLSAGDTKGSVIIGTGSEARQVDIRIVPVKSFGAALQYFTGSKAHNIKLRTLAKDKGLKVSEYGVFRGNRFIAGRTEEEVYKVLGLAWVPPELREDRGEIEAAMKNKLPDLIKLSDIKGDLQVHSNYSDGTQTIEEMAKKAQALGYEYIAITDHSQSVHYAHGLSIDRLKKQWDEIERVNNKFPKFKIIKGIEVDILTNGKLDYPDKILAQCELVIAAIHQGFKKNVTERIISALQNPYVHILAHPSGRLISKREGYDVDLEKVLEWALKYNKVLEINAYPDRLDLNDLYARKAKEMGIRLAINTDAHGLLDMEWMRYGVGQARRGWLEKKDVINTLSYKELFSTLRPLNPQ
uniref:DNA-directed DNA polymerase n=1 Tax=candidate division WOR-3 bacterium TaxID=2052148 RepID=A0A7C6A978_UNCW3